MQQALVDVATIDAKWLSKAAKRTAKLLKVGSYAEKSSIWSLVKPLYMRVQHDKCIFCEQRLEGGTYGPVAWDLEHFRPKSNVTVWPDPGRHPELHYAQLGAASPNGYFWLAYELTNYAACCKVCNSIFKLNWFPIVGIRADAPENDLAAEQALLCYPLGDGDEDPENLVTFVLTTAVPSHRTGARNLRGQVIIDFFGLNRRDSVHRSRAQMIGALGSLMAEREAGGASPAVLGMIQQMSGDHVPHASCVRAFKKLWEEDIVAARRGYEACRAYGFDPSAAPPSP